MQPSVCLILAIPSCATAPLFFRVGEGVVLKIGIGFRIATHSPQGLYCSALRRASRELPFNPLCPALFGFLSPG